MIWNNQKHKPNGAPPKAAPAFLIILYHKSLWIFPQLFHICFPNMFHIFSLVCFLIYRVERRQALIAKPPSYLFHLLSYPFIYYIYNIYIYIYISYIYIERERERERKKDREKDRERERERQSEWVSEWVSEWMSEGVSEGTNERVSERLSEWVIACVRE